MKKYILAIGMLTAIGCGQSDKEANQPGGKSGADGSLPAAKDSNLILINDEGRDTVNTLQKREPFTEGVINTTITFPGNPMNEELKKMGGKFDIKKFYGMMAGVMNDSTEKDKSKAMAKMMNLASISILPVKNQLLYSSVKVLTHGEAMAYRYDNLFDKGSKKGSMVLYSRRNEEKIGYTYSTAVKGSMISRPEITDGMYLINATKEEKEIGGFKCKKVIYNKKPGQAQGPESGLLPDQIVVWYTSELPAGLNFDQAFNIAVDGAIMRSEIILNKSSKMKMVYQITSIEARKIRPSEFNLPQVDEEFDLDTESRAAAMAFLRIMGGMSLLGEMNKNKNKE